MTELLFTRGGETPEQIAAMEERLKQTEITQPAVLTADIAILRLLDAYGVRPDVVCGHSLGEYGALVASGVLSFKDALSAVSARGKEMAGVRVKDPGKMASIAAPIEKIEPVLKEIEGYVACANKNCPSQTVIAGESRAVAAAIKRFGALGIQAQEIRVSHAFHSKIVEPAQEPYRKFLDRLKIEPPKIPVLSNVTAAYYPEDPKEIRDLMVAQIASSVEFIRQTERMRQDGVRLFIEVGPKRVLTAFVTSTLEKRKDWSALSSNHPKRGGILEFNDLLARLDAEGVALSLIDKAPDRPAAFYTPGYFHWISAQGATRSLDPMPLPPGSGGDGIVETMAGHSRYARHGDQDAASLAGAELESRWGFYTGPVVVSGIAAGTPGAWDRVFREDSIDQILRGQNLIGKLGDADIQSQLDKNIVRLIKSTTGDHRLERIENAAEVVHLAATAGEFDLAGEFGFKESVADAMDVSSRLAVAAGILALKDAGIPLVPTYKETTTGSSLPSGWALPEALRGETGVIFATSFPSIDSMASEVSRHLADKFRRKPLRELAGLLESLIARLKDPQDRAAVEHWYAATFRSYMERYGGDGPYEFSREFLLRVMPLGHAQFMQWLGAQGPAVQISAACASTTQAVAMAEDWIRLGRAKRVIVIAGDDVTSPSLREWMVTGFLSAGAATTTPVVSEAALPFDRRRHGMILGMGAAALVVEAGGKVAERGMRGLSEILAGQYENSAFHVTRLHVDHVAQVMERLVSKAEKRWGIRRREIAEKTLFMSHETYTPARGGSASAEVTALKRAFGPQAERILVANTKGFHGHSMGASIEEPVSIRALVTGRVPPIANYRQPDPDLSGITLSQGGEHDLEYVLRLGAGFGSQIAMTLMRRILRTSESRIADPARNRDWLRGVSGLENPELEVVQNALRVKSTQRAPAATPALASMPAVAPRIPSPVASAARSASTTPAPSSSASPAVATQPKAGRPAAPGEDSVRETVVSLVSEKTGYPAEMLELDLDLEADLGIDTVKQAEMFAILREAYDIPRREGIALKDYPTLRHLIRFVQESQPGSARDGGPGVSAPKPVEPSVRETPDAREAGAEFHRWIPQAYERPAASFGARPVDKNRPVAVLSPRGASTPWMKSLEKAGLTLVSVPTAKWTDEASTLKALGKNLGSQKPQAILYAAGLELGSFDPEDFDRAYSSALRPLFLAAKALHKRLGQDGGILVPVRIDGLHGIGGRGEYLPPGAEFNPLAGGLAGLAKALRKEIPEAWVRIVDFAPETSGDLLGKALLAELQSLDSHAEIGYRDGVRRGIRLVSQDIDAQAESRELNRDSVVWITGGGQGLGAECAKELTRRARCRLVIFGRTPLAPQAARWAAATPQELETLKRGLWETMRSDPSQKASPVRLEREFSKILKTAQLHRNLSEMRKAGAEVNYVAVDLASGSDVRKSLKDLDKKWRAPDWVLHAAGLDQSRRFTEKTPQEFDEIFRAKAHAAVHLLRYAAATPQTTWIFFSSVVGRFGNLAQTDYAAASDFLAKLASHLRGRGLRASAVDLTAVSQIGMAARGSVEEFLRSQGVDFMPPAEAVRRILLEAEHDGQESEVLLAASLGRLDQDGQMSRSDDQFVLRPATAKPPVTTRSDPGSLSMRTLIDRELKREAGREIATEKKFSLESDPWLADHSISGTPYVAGVMGLELFAQTVTALSLSPAEFHDVRFALPIKLLRNKPVTVRTLAGKTPQGWNLSIESDFITPQGLKLGGPRTHFTARLQDAVSRPEESKKDRAPGGSTGHIVPGKVTIPAETIYSAYFHGPSFQVLEGIVHLTDQEILSKIRKPAKPLWPGADKALLLHPLLVEAAFQTCGYRDLHLSRKMTLPDSIGRIRVRLAPPEWPQGELFVRARFKGTDKEGRSLWDAEVSGQDGHAWVELDEYRMIPVAP
ncbi:MAG: SDR family NAD(P)-dependent oxidoreductase [Elusimicrobia bacterium]|nr:SDR family NAD(P)-dependent oxidoreductase [Elusimicrobiota bacterium]